MGEKPCIGLITPFKSPLAGAGKAMHNAPMKTLRCMQVVNVRWFNATAWYGVYLAKLLQEAGHESLVVGLPDSPPLRKAEAWGISTVALPLNTGNPFSVPGLYADMRRLVRKFRPDVVNCHRGEAFPLWALLKRQSGSFRLIRTRGDQRAPKNNPMNRLLHARCADAVITTNSKLAKYVAELGVPDDHIHIILGGVDNAAFYPDKVAGSNIRYKYGFGSCFVVGILGRLDPVKGHAVLIEALGLLKKRYQDAFTIKLLCIGADAGLNAHNIMDLAGLQNLQEDCTVTGRVDDVRATINAMDLGVLASVDSEAIARAALEIMACGVPLLSTDVGVMPDILPPTSLIPIGDASVMAEAIERAWLRPEALAAYGQAAGQALNGLRSHDFLEKTLHVYRQCLHENAPLP